MITRFYRVRIKPELRDEFEPLFKTVAVASVVGAEGCKRVVVAGPCEQSPNEYALISEWQSEDQIKAFAGSDWSLPHIPEGMEIFIDECWVHHFVHFTYEIEAH